MAVLRNITTGTCATITGVAASADAVEVNSGLVRTLAFTMAFSVSATVQVQASFDGGTTWLSYTATQTTTTAIVLPYPPIGQYRVNATVDAGTVNSIAFSQNIGA